jgi:hypothetical protein
MEGLFVAVDQYVLSAHKHCESAVTCEYMIKAESAGGRAPGKALLSAPRTVWSKVQPIAGPQVSNQSPTIQGCRACQLAPTSFQSVPASCPHLPPLAPPLSSSSRRHGPRPHAVRAGADACVRRCCRARNLARRACAGARALPARVLGAARRGARRVACGHRRPRQCATAPILRGLAKAWTAAKHRTGDNSLSGCMPWACLHARGSAQTRLDKLHADAALRFPMQSI